SEPAQTTWRILSALISSSPKSLQVRLRIVWPAGCFARPCGIKHPSVINGKLHTAGADVDVLHKPGDIGFVDQTRQDHVRLLGREHPAGVAETETGEGCLLNRAELRRVAVAEQRFDRFAMSARFLDRRGRRNIFGGDAVVLRDRQAVLEDAELGRGLALGDFAFGEERLAARARDALSKERRRAFGFTIITGRNGKGTGHGHYTITDQRSK